MQSNRPLSTKKNQILEQWKSGHRDLWHLAEDLDTRPSYVASVLQQEGLLRGYSDLYTKAESSLNVYDQELRGKLGFKDLETAQKSLQLIDSYYQRFEELKDRAGQHQCLVTALTLFNRARFIGKAKEAKIFQKWLLEKVGSPIGAIRRSDLAESGVSSSSGVGTSRS